MRRRDAHKRERIVDAAVRAVCRGGFHGVSIAGIAREAEVSPATVYIYFRNKEEMLIEIFRESAALFLERLTDGVSGEESGAEIIRRLIENDYHFLLSNPERHHYMEQFIACPSPPEKELFQKPMARLYRLFDLLKERGELERLENETLFAMLFSPIKAVALRALFKQREDPAALEEIVRVTQKALLRERPGAGAEASAARPGAESGSLRYLEG